MGDQLRAFELPKRTLSKLPNAFWDPLKVVELLKRTIPIPNDLLFQKVIIIKRPFR